MTDAHTICASLGGRWHGSYGIAFCPAHQNTRTPALSLKDGDDGKLLVHCFAGCDARYILAALRAKGLLPGRSDWKPDPAKAEQRRADQDADDKRRIEMARRCWSEAGDINGTLGEKYLRRRSITCDLPPTIRFNAATWHGPTASKLPAMVAAVAIGPTLVGIHRTYLADPGVKAFTCNTKMMLGRCAGGAVRLSGGPGALVVAEGIETGLSLLSGLHDRQPRVWAALSTSGMAGLILPPDPGGLVLAPDGDQPGRDAAKKLTHRAIRAGWRVRVMEIQDGRDWNDLTSEAAA